MSGTLALSILVGVLQTIGVILLWVLLVLLILILLILFVPVRYRAEGCVADPDGHDELNDEVLDFLKQNARGTLSFSWLLQLVHGGISWPESPVFTLKILFWKMDVGEVIRKNQEKRKAAGGRKGNLEGQDGKEGSRREKTREEKLREIRGKLPEYRMFLKKESSKRALRKMQDVGGGALRKILPREWNVNGTVGLGDPELTGSFLAVEGALVMLTGEHVWILPEYQKVQADLSGMAVGKIRLIGLAAAALKLLFDRDVRGIFRYVKEQREEINA